MGLIISGDYRAWSQLLLKSYWIYSFKIDFTLARPLLNYGGEKLSLIAVDHFRRLCYDNVRTVST